MEQYKAVVYREGFFRSLIRKLLPLPARKLQDRLRSSFERGWEVVSIEKDIQPGMILPILPCHAYTVLLCRVNA